MPDYRVGESGSEGSLKQESRGQNEAEPLEEPFIEHVICWVQLEKLSTFLLLKTHTNTRRGKVLFSIPLY